ncbi:hypothetical protein [Nostoc sp.]|uniref:hypothetical protein n=1 Tax=Nostoc sp. TaxID=1180 RepID=UPI002FF6ACCB
MTHLSNIAFIRAKNGKTEALGSRASLKTTATASGDRFAWTSNRGQLICDRW